MKIKVLNYFIVNKSKSNQKIIFDVKILENEIKGLLDKKFISENGDLSFIVLSVGHINPPVENFYVITVKIDGDYKLEKFKNSVFIDKN